MRSMMVKEADATRKTCFKRDVINVSHIVWRRTVLKRAVHSSNYNVTTLNEANNRKTHTFRNMLETNAPFSHVDLRLFKLQLHISIEHYVRMLSVLNLFEFITLFIVSLLSCILLVFRLNCLSPCLRLHMIARTEDEAKVKRTYEHKR